MPSYDQIIEHCSGFDRVSGDGGSGSGDLLQPLESIGLTYSRLRLDQVRALAVALSRTLIDRSMNAIYSSDNHKFWDAVGKQLLDTKSLYFNERDDSGPEFFLATDNLKDLFTTVIKIQSHSWAVLPHNTISTWGWPPDYVGIPPSSSKTTEYLVYPLLEAVLKRELSEFFFPSGRVAKPFPGLWPDGGPRSYKVNQYCSDVANILRLYMTQPEFAELSCDLQKILDHIESIYPDTTAFNVISTDWRNPAIHSANPVNTAPGVVLNIIILIALSHIDNSQWDAKYDANGGTAIT